MRTFAFSIRSQKIIPFGYQYLYTEKSYKIRDHTPDFLINIRSTLSNLMDLCIREYLILRAGDEELIYVLDFLKMPWNGDIFQGQQIKQ